MTELTPSGDVDPRTERIIWREIGKTSLRQIAEKTGLSVEAVLRIKNEMIDNVDVLTIEQRRMKLIIDLQAISDRAREMAESTRDERSLAPLLATSVTAMKTILNELRNEERKGTSEVERLNELRQRELITLMQSTVDNGVTEIAEKHGLDKQELFDIFNAKLMEAATEMTERNDQ